MAIHKKYNRILEDFIDINDDIIIPDDIEDENIDGTGYNLMFNLMADVNENDDYDEFTPIEIVVNRLNAFLDSFSSVVSHTCPVALSVDSDDGSPVWLDDVTRPSEETYVVANRINICFYANLKKMSVSNTFNFLVGLFNVANKNIVDYESLEFFKRYENGFNYNYIYPVELRSLARLLKDTHIKVKYEGFIPASKQKYLNTNSAREWYYTITPLIKNEPMGYADFSKFIEYDYLETEVTNGALRSCGIYDTDACRTLEDGETIALDAERLMNAKISYYAAKADEHEYEQGILNNEPASTIDNEIIEALRKHKITVSSVKLYESTLDSNSVFIIYSEPFLSENDVKSSDEPLYSMWEVCFYIVFTRTSSSVMEVPEKMKEILGVNEPYALRLQNWFEIWSQRLKEMETRNSRVNESMKFMQPVNEDYIDDLKDDEIVTKEIEDEDDSYDEYDKVMFLQVSYMADKQTEFHVKEISEKKDRLIRILSYYIRQSALVTSFSKPKIITDEYLVSKRSGDMITLVDDREFQYKNYIAVVFGFNFRDEPSPSMVLRFLNNCFNAIVACHIPMYKITVAPAKHRHICSTLDASTFIDLYAAYQKKLNKKLRIETCQAGLNMMMQFTDSEAFLYDYQKVINEPLMFQKNMMHKMYFSAESKTTNVLQEITDDSIKRALYAHKMDGDAIFYATNRYIYMPNIQTDPLQLVTSESVLSYYKERLYSEPVQPDLIDLYNAGKDFYMLICVKSYFNKGFDDYTILGFVVRFKPQDDSQIASVLTHMFRMSEEKAALVAKKIYVYFEKK